MFGLSNKQQEQLDIWRKEQKIKQKYAGAIGGALTYSFTPTTLGMVVKVTNGFNNESIDLSDYDSW